VVGRGRAFGVALTIDRSGRWERASLGQGGFLAPHMRIRGEAGVFLPSRVLPVATGAGGGTRLLVAAAR
jgi:hypothetical protein